MEWSELLTAIEQVSAVATLPGAVIVASMVLGGTLVASVVIVCAIFAGLAMAPALMSAPSVTQ